MNAQRLELLVESVTRLVRRGAMPNLLKIFDKAHPVEIAAVLQNLPRPVRRETFAALFTHDGDKTAEAIAELTPDVAERLLDPLETEQIETILAKMSPDDAAAILDQFPEERRDELMARMNVEAEVEELLEFPSETAGRIMTPKVLAFNEELSVQQAIEELQRSEEAESPFYLYIVDDRMHLVGVVSLRALLMSYVRAPDRALKDLMQTEIISVRSSADQEEVARLVADYNLLAIPVVDDENKLVGLVTVDDVLDVIREEATEDIFALAGVDADDRALGDARKSFRRRIPWLLLSLGTGLISVFVVSQFETTIKDHAHIAFLLPLVAALGGHAATQTMTVVVRGISTGEVNADTRNRAFIKEGLVGLLNGCLMSFASAIAIAVFMGETVPEKLTLAAVVFSAVFIIMVVSSVVGAFFPMLLKRLKGDPAVASSVFVITFTDVLGFLAYLALARLALAVVARFMPAAG